jgi:hypothetical protein
LSTAGRRLDFQGNPTLTAWSPAVPVSPEPALQVEIDTEGRITRRSGSLGSIDPALVSALRQAT